MKYFEMSHFQTMMISRALNVLIFFLNLNNTFAWDGCESAFAWRCGDKCIHGGLSNEQETMRKCGGVLFNKAALMWYCNNEPCDGKGTKRKDNTWLGERDNEGKVIGAECSGTPLKLTQPCNETCNGDLEGRYRNNYGFLRSCVACNVANLKIYQCIREDKDKNGKVDCRNRADEEIFRNEKFEVRIIPYTTINTDSD